MDDARMLISLSGEAACEPRARQGGVSRSFLMVGLYAVGLVNALLAEIAVQIAADSALEALGGLNMVVLLACGVGLHLSARRRLEPIGLLDGVAGLLFAAIIMVPHGRVSWLGVGLLAAYDLARSRRDPVAVARGMLEAINHTDAPVTEAMLHRYRIVSKRARYAAEFAGQSPEAARFVAAIKHVQDALGDWHDWLTLTQTSSEHLGEVRESSLVAELHNVTGAKFRHAVAVLSQMREAPGAAKPTVTAQVPAHAETKSRASRSAA